MASVLAGFHDAGHGYDLFGLEPRAVRWATALTGPICRRYFRVVSTGIEHVPATGPAILVANHAGALPIDGGVLWSRAARAPRRAAGRGRRRSGGARRRRRAGPRR